MRRTSASLRFCRACGKSMARPHNTCGTTTTAWRMSSSKAKGEQGDPLMPGLFAHPALQATQAMLLPGEVLFTFLDDIYILSRPGRARAIFEILQARLQAHAGIQVSAWNAGGVLPPGVDAFGTAEDPSWVGDLSLPPHQQGLVVLGSPLGSHAFTQAFLAEKRASQDTLLQRIPAVPHLQSAWLILLLCGAPRANYLLRILPPCHARAFARKHDAAVLRCLGRLLSAEEPLELDALQLPLARGGMGLRSAGRGGSGHLGLIPCP